MSDNPKLKKTEVKVLSLVIYYEEWQEQESP